VDSGKQLLLHCIEAVISDDG